MSAYDDGTPMSSLAEYVGRRGWQLVATQWHRDPRTGKAGNTPIRGVSGRAPFLTVPQVQAKVHELVLHREGGPDCIGRNGKTAARPPLFVTLFDVDHGYSGKSGGDTLVNLEMQLGPLPGSYSVTARGPWQPSRRIAYRHAPDLVIQDAFFGQFGGCIETIRTGHRFTWIPPSIHVRRGKVVGPVLWYDRDHNVADMPHVDDLPELPAAWQQAIREHNATRRSSSAAAREGLAPGEPTVIEEGHADAIVAKLAEQLHDLAPEGGQFRNTVFGLAAAIARREVARGGTRQSAMDLVEDVFAEHPHRLSMDSDDVRWADEGIDQGWAEPWQFGSGLTVLLGGVDPKTVTWTATPAQFMRGEATPVLGTGEIVSSVDNADNADPSGLATEAELAYFFGAYTRCLAPERLDLRVGWAMADDVTRLPVHAARLIEEAMSGLYPARQGYLGLLAACRRHGVSETRAETEFAAALNRILDARMAGAQ